MTEFSQLFEPQLIRRLLRNGLSVNQLLQLIRHSVCQRKMRSEARHNDRLHGDFAGHFGDRLHPNVEAKHGLDTAFSSQASQLGSGHQRVGGNGFGSQPVQSEPCDCEFGAVRKDKHHSVALPDSKLPQGTRRLLNPVEQILVSVARSEIANGNSVGIAFDRRLKELLNPARRVLNPRRNSRRVRVVPGSRRRVEIRRHGKGRIRKITSRLERYSFHWQLPLSLSGVQVTSPVADWGWTKSVSRFRQS